MPKSTNQWGRLAKAAVKTPDETEDHIEAAFYKLQKIMAAKIPPWTVTFNNPYWNAIHAALEDLYRIQGKSKRYYAAAAHVLYHVRRAFNNWAYLYEGDHSLRVEHWKTFISVMMEGSMDDRECRMWEGELKRGW